MPKSARWIVGALFTVHLALLAWAAVRHSPTWDEVGALPAGISHWTFGGFDLYRVNPPLVRLLASAPVIAASVDVDWGDYGSHAKGRPEFTIGKHFIQDQGPRALWLFVVARWACIPLSLLGAWICFRWARELYGDLAGLPALGLWCFSPNILAHGQLLTPDVGATALGVAAAYSFWRWLRAPTWTGALVAGVVLGLAQLTKFTLVVFFPFWPVVWLVWRLGSPHPAPLPKGEGRREAAQLVVVLVLAVYVINVGYGFEGSLKPLGEYRFVSRLFAGHDDAATVAVVGANRFAGTWLGVIPMPLPENYLRGIDRQRLDFENKLWSYLRGEWRLGGWWYYYLYGLAIKVPVGTWVLIGLALGVSVFGARASKAGREGGGETDKNVCPTVKTGKDACPTVGTDKNVCPPGAYSASWRDEMVLLAPLVVILTLVSSQTGFNHHLRYVLPIFPFGFIWMSKVARAVEFGWGKEGTRGEGGGGKGPMTKAQ